MGNGGAKQGHDAIAQHLVHRALEAVHGVHHALQGRIEELLGGFWVEVADQLGGAFDIGKQHRDLLAFAGQVGPRGEDFLAEIRWGIGLRRRSGVGEWRRRRGASCPDQHRAILIHGESLGFNEFGLQVGKIVVIQVELTLERSIRHNARGAAASQ